MLSQPLKAWRSALEVKSFREKFIIAGVTLVLCAIAAPFLFPYIQQRKGHFLNDFFLNWLPALDLSFWIFLLLYLLILSGATVLIGNPKRFLLVMQAYVILTVFRFITMLLFPLEPPAYIIELKDPLVQYFFYQQSVTKDLFFSGHTSILVLFALAMEKTQLRIMFLLGAIAVAAMLLLQHAHYTVDVLFAPVFSWVALAIARKIDKNQ